jgi:hypothetical protein
MRKAACFFGLAWMALAAVTACLVLFQYGVISAHGGPRFYALVPILFLCGAPGALLFQWGRGPYVRPPTVTEMLRPKAPYERAAEAGHVLKTDTHA